MQHSMGKRLIWLIWLSACCGLHAQWRGPILTPLGPTEGLPTIVNKMVADSTGYVYIASNVGLYRYDGHAFTFYSHDPMDDHSIGAGEILNIMAGRDGLIWMTLRFGGLNSFNPKTGIFKRYPLPEMSFRSIPSANALFEDPDGPLWVGATHFRLFAFDRVKEQYTLYTPDWINPEKDRGRLSIITITPDPHHPDSLWLSVLDYAADGSMFNSFGLVLFEKTSKKFQDTPYAGNTDYVDKTGIMWGTHWGNFITRFDPASMSMDTFQHHYLHDGQDLRPLSKDVISYRGRLLVASSLEVMEFTDNHFTSFISGERTGEIYSLFADPDQNLWIGTNQGALVLNPDDQHIHYFSLDQFGIYNRIFPGRLAHDDQKDVMYLSHTLYPHPSGYYQIPLEEKKNSDVAFIATPFPVLGMAFDLHHRLWAVGSGALYILNPLDQTFTKQKIRDAENRPLPGTFFMESNKEGWIGMIGTREFAWFHPDENNLKRVHIDQLPGSAFAKSFDNSFEGFSFNQDHIAYLFSNEVHRVDLKTGKITALRYDPIVNPYTQQIQYAGEDASGNIWMSTFVHTGRYHLQEDSLILMESFGIHQGLISAGASQLHIDQNGRVWVFTGSGLNAIDPPTHEVRFFGTKEGLPFSFLDPRQVLSISDGRLATVAHNGLIVFHADELWKSVAPEDEPIVIKRIRIGGKDYASDVAVNQIHHLELKADNTGFDIEFQALAYPTDDKMEYSYRILGLQEEWISIGRNQLITLPSLGPGQYAFEIKAGNPLSQAPVKSLEIHVQTPLYRKAWFILLMLIALSAAVYALLQWRIRRIRDQEAERTEINKQMAELELKALRSQMNPHFMFNSLNSIKNYILHAEPKLAAEYLSNFAHLIRMILQNSREKAITLQEELETLILYIELEQIRFDNKFEFNCVVEDGLNLEQIKIPPMLLQPFIENAIWHGLMHKKEKGHLMITFSKQEDKVACIIDDDGVGRNKAAEMKSLSATKYKSMGMGITRDRIELINKMDALGISIEIVDKTNGNGKSSGTKVIVRIPGPEA